jgi:transposase
MATQVHRNGPESAPDFAAFVAIDWGNDKHVWVTQDAQSGIRERGELEARPEVVDAWITAYLARYPGRLIAVALEQKRGALLYMLMKYERVVIYPIHGGTASNFRAALYPSGSKDDPKDADVIMELLIQHRDRLRRLEPDTVETRTLQLLVEKRRKLVDERTRQSNRLTDELKMYFPQVMRWFDDVQSPLVADFLKRWPTLPDLQRARPGTLRHFFHQHNCRNEERIEGRLQEMRQAVAVTTDAALVEPTVIMVRALVQYIAGLSEGVREYEEKIEQIMAVHPEAKLFQSFPSAGAALAPRLVVAFGTDRERYAHAIEIGCLTGIAPVRERSGKRDHIHFRYACSKFLRQTFHEWASHSIARSSWARAYYDQQRAKGSGHHAAVRALAFKWIRILFRCWKDRKPYDEQTYIQALRRHGSKLAAALATA